MATRANLIDRFMAGNDLPHTLAGVLQRCGVRADAAEQWADAMTDWRAEEEGDDEPDPQGWDMGEGNELRMYGPIAGGFDAVLLTMLGIPVVTVDAVRARLAEIEGDVVLRINSPGGGTADMAAIYTMLGERKRSGARVDAIVDGMAASAAAVIFLAGERREMSTFASLMYHRAWSALVVVGNQNDVRSVMRSALSNMEAFDGTQARLLMAVTGQDEAWAADTLDNELWYNAASAVEAGLATGEVEAGGDHERRNEEEDYETYATAVEGDLTGAAREFDRMVGMLAVTH